MTRTRTSTVKTRSLVTIFNELVKNSNGYDYDSIVTFFGLPDRREPADVTGQEIEYFKRARITYYEFTGNFITDRDLQGERTYPEYRIVHEHRASSKPVFTTTKTLVRINGTLPDNPSRYVLYYRNAIETDGFGGGEDQDYGLDGERPPAEGILYLVREYDVPGRVNEFIYASAGYQVVQFERKVRIPLYTSVEIKREVVIASDLLPIED